MEHEEIWEAIIRLEGQLAKIRADLDDVYKEIHIFKTEYWQLEDKVGRIERSVQVVERACR
jgi:regulator of replication initiation timing